MKNFLEGLRHRRPLIEAITNYVTVNDVANAILAAGASPVMADSAEDVAEFVRLSQGVLVNIGTLSEPVMNAIRIACTEAKNCGRPVVLDPAGAGATAYRTAVVRELLENGYITVLRGNASELAAVCGDSAQTRGVDAAADDEITDRTLARHCDVAQGLARRYHCVAAMSGKIDIIADAAGHLWCCRNGVDWMPRVTGTGCALSGISAAAVAAYPERPGEATASAFAVMGCAGEIALKKCQSLQEGVASFRVRLLDALSLMDDAQLNEYCRLEEIH